MRVLLQRVARAQVSVDGNIVGSIGRGLLVFLGVSRSDTNADADYLLEKTLFLRIFPDESDKMNRNVQEVNGSLLIISQFTLHADCRRGRRPSFDQAAPPQEAQAFYDYFVATARRGSVPVECGVFQAMMQVELVNEGPVTILIDSAERNRK